MLLEQLGRRVTEAADHDRRAGLCGHCRHADRIVSSRGTVFYLCRRSFTDPAFPKYPPLPVVACAGYEAETDPRAVTGRLERRRHAAHRDGHVVVPA